MTTRTDTSVLVEHAKTTPPSQIILKLTRPQRRIDLSSDEGPRSPPARETTLRDCLLIEEVRFAVDSPLEEAVSSEPVSEVEELGTREGCQFR